MAPKYVNKLEGELMLVVGGTSGIGFAVVEACIEHGASVVISSRWQDNVDKAIEKLKSTYLDAANRIRGHTCNLSQDDCELEIVELCEFATGGGSNTVDHVVNTAGEGGITGNDL